MSVDISPSQQDAASTPAPKVDPESLALRASPARAMRFKRGVIVSAAGVTAVVVVATTWFALEPHALHLAAGEDDQSVVAKPPTDTLSTLPTSYGTVPKLGPPLPGDLGRPILDRQRQLASETSSPGAGADQVVNQERQRRADELLAARQSGLLAQSADRVSAVNWPPTPAAVPVAAATNPDEVALDPERDSNGQQRKADFARTAERGGTINPYAVVASPSPFTVSAGSVIAASLITGLRSDLPGLVTAQVTEQVYDSATGRILLIPQGARLIGSYDSVVAFGQKRALVVWQRILMPDGSSIRIDNAPAADPAGYAGLEDKVDFHTWSLLKGVVLSTALGVGAELQFSGQGDLVQALRQSTQQSVSRAGDQLTSRSLQVQPTITIRPGAAVRLVVHQDLVLKPWREQP